MSGDLVNRLRNLAEVNPLKQTLPGGAVIVKCSLEVFTQIKELAGDAADAIEDLAYQNAKWEKAVKTTLDFIPCWVSVTERLPEDSGDYLVNDSCGNIFQNFFGTEIRRWSARDGMITHWMPLPPGPEPIEEAPAEDTNVPTGPYDLLYEEGGANTT